MLPGAVPTCEYRSESVSRFVFEWLFMSVCVPSQMISVITTTGNSALRRKRFTDSLSAGYQRLCSQTMALLRRLRDCVRVQYGHVGEIPVPLPEVEAVADHELVRNLEARVADGDVDLAAGRLRQQRADLERRWVARLEHSHQVRQRQAGVDDVLHDEHVAAFDVDVEILEDPDDARRIGRRAVARDRHEVDLAWNRQLSHQIGHEEHRALEDADEQEILAGVVGRDV